MPPSTRRCPTSGWRLGRKSSKPRLRSGLLLPRRPMPRKTGSMVATSAATSYRIGLPTSRSARRRFGLRRPSSRRRPRRLQKKRQKPTQGRRAQEARQACRAALARARPQSAEELHRSRKPDHEIKGRLRAGLQWPDRGGCQGADHRGPGRDAMCRRQRPTGADDAIEANLGRKPEQASGLPSAEVARRFGYTAAAFRMLCYEFRRGQLPDFFAVRRPGPREQPKKGKVRDQVVALRKRNYSIYDISP